MIYLYCLANYIAVRVHKDLTELTPKVYLLILDYRS